MWGTLFCFSADKIAASEIGATPPYDGNLYPICGEAHTEDQAIIIRGSARIDLHAREPTQERELLVDKREDQGMHSAQLPRIDSPLAKIFLSEYISRLVQETIRYRALPCKKLAQQVNIPSPALQVAIEGQLGLTRGQWNMLGQVLGLTAKFEVRLSERHGQPCWEAYFPPVTATKS